MRAGALRHRIRIERQTPVDLPSGEVSQAWTLVAEVCADVRPLAGRELILAQQQQSDAQVTIQLRWFPGLDATHRIVHGASLYAITAPPINVDGRGREMQLLCRVATLWGRRMTTRVTGLAELRTAFAAFGQSLDSAKGPLRRVTRQFANKVAKLAREKVPVDEGKLRASIRAIGLREAQAQKEGLTVALIVAPSNPRPTRPLAASSASRAR